MAENKNLKRLVEISAAVIIAGSTCLFLMGVYVVFRAAF